MLQSLKLSNLILRLCLAAVFLWFGIDKFIHPNYWIDAWLPQSVVAISESIGLGSKEFMYLNGIIEVLIGVSLISTLLMRVFAPIGILILIGVMVFHGFNEILIRDLGLIGGLAALIFWPDRRFY
ncbi:MAG: DoxX family membrane protein [Patescibacteria group bacterium]